MVCPGIQALLSSVWQKTARIRAVFHFQTGDESLAQRVKGVSLSFKRIGEAFLFSDEQQFVVH